MYLDMAYCWAIPNEEHSLTRNRAQAPMPFLVGPNPASITEIYTKQFGVPLSKLGILLPWWGVSYDCVGDNTAGTAYGGCPVVGPKFSKAVVLFSSIATDYFPNATAPPFLNETLQTKVLNFHDGSGTRQQLWFDDAQTLATKYLAQKPCLSPPSPPPPASYSCPLPLAVPLISRCASHLGIPLRVQVCRDQGRGSAGRGHVDC